MTAPAIAIIQARMSSTRLPGKVLMPLAGKPMIWHIVERARECHLIDTVVVVTSEEESDTPLADYCHREQIVCYRGSLNNVMSRYLEVLDAHTYNYFVRITGDCPLIHPPFIDRQIEALIAYDGDLIRADFASTLLEGQGANSSRSLRWVAQHSEHPDDLEHVGSRYFTEHASEFRWVSLSIPENFRQKCWRLTVDEEPDYRLMSAIYDELFSGEIIPLEGVVDFLKNNIQVGLINQNVNHSAINLELAAKRADQQPNLVGFAQW